jgi:hypothetical protein
MDDGSHSHQHQHDHGPATPVAASEIGCVSLCAGCGVVHLQLQYLTLRLEPDAFHDLARLLAQAQARIALATADAAPPAALTAGRGFH